MDGGRGVGGRCLVNSPPPPTTHSYLEHSILSEHKHRDHIAIHRNTADLTTPYTLRTVECFKIYLNVTKNIVLYVVDSLLELWEPPSPQSSLNIPGVNKVLSPHLTFEDLNMERFLRNGALTKLHAGGPGPLAMR